ncbi:hypothetical protein HDU93_009798 [Gonapodya sp. JEL0774]|nr:hypothetical protein HDU93_009798 [Gonapodya sp. JEL0774]
MPLIVEKVEQVELRETSNGSATDDKPLESEMALEDPPDGGYGWIVVVANFFLNFFGVGLSTVFGLFQKNYLLGTDFEGSNNLQISIIGSLQIGGITVLAPLAGQLSDRYGPARVAVCGAVLSAAGYVAASFSTAIWHLYLTQGLMYGLGACFSLIPATSVMPGWFKKRRGLASGISSAGTGAAGLTLAPLVQHLLDNFGWRTTLRVIAAMVAVVIVPCSLVLKQWRPAAEIARRKISKPTTSFLPLYLFKDASFILTCLTISLAAISFFAPQSYIPLALDDGGYSDSVGSAVVSGLAATILFSRIGMGLLNE